MISRIQSALLSSLPVAVSRDIIHNVLGVTEIEQSASQQLLIDISEVITQDARTGIQRVVRGLLSNLMEHPPAGFDVRPVFADRKLGYRYAPVTPNCLQAGEHERAMAQQVEAGANDIFFGLDLTAHLVHRHQHQLLCWKRQKVRICFLVYDLLPVLHPHWFTPRRFKVFNRWLHTLAIYSDDLICISETVRSDLDRWLENKYRLTAGAIRLHTIPLGADIAATAPSRGCSEEERALLSRLLERPFVLMVGTLEPRKGYTEALAAFELLWGDGCEVSLVIVGKPGWKTEKLQQYLRVCANRNNKLYWFESASDELLQKLYMMSLGVLLASEAEGFGLPLIEANYYNKFILARDIPAYREMKIDGIDFFDSAGFDSQLARWIRKILSNCTQPDSMQCNTWDDSVVKLLHIVGIT